jgi:hypothetical protein
MTRQPLKTPPPDRLPFATRIPWRSPEWKFHTSRRAASGALAIKTRYYCELWAMGADGVWELVKVQEATR